METAAVSRETGSEGCRSLEELENEIGELSAHIDAATCRLLLAIAEFDRREGWGRSGFRSCAHWLGWRVGLDLATARERLRVGRALEELPKIRAAFAAGQISYSKVRAISRVATPENEQELLEIARHGTALHLERLTRLFRDCTSSEERQRARRQHEQRYLQTWTDEDGMLCIRGRLPPEVGALVKQALEAAMRELGDRPVEARPPEVAEVTSGVATPKVSAEEQVKPGVATPKVSAEPSSEPWSEHIASESSEAELDDDEVDPICVLLPATSEAEDEATAERELRESVCGTFVPFGPSPRVRPMVEVAPSEQDQRTADALGLLCEWALDSIHTRQGGAIAPRGRTGAPGREGRFEVILHVDAEVLAADAPVGRCDVEGGPRLAAESMRRLCCSSPVVTLLHGKESELLGPGRRTRRISAPLWRALRSRDETCAWPGCTARRGLVVHHVEHWAHGGETKLPNLLTTCKAHHWALHEGGFRVEGRAPDDLKFFTPDGHELPSCPLPRRVDGTALARANRERGLAIGPNTGLTRWEGEPMDYQWALDSLLHQKRRSG